MSAALAHVAAVMAEEPPGQTVLSEETLRTLNPKHLLVAQAFLRMLLADEMAPLILRARSADDLKLLLIADAFFARVADVEARARISALLLSESCTLDDVLRALAVCWLRETYIPAAAPPAAPGATPDMLYTADGASRELGLPLGDVLAAVADGRVEGVVCLTASAVDTLRRGAR